MSVTILKIVFTQENSENFRKSNNSPCEKKAIQLKKSASIRQTEIPQIPLKVTQPFVDVIST